MIDEAKDDSESFIFTLKNPHGTSPSRYTRRVGYSCSITCDSSCGPIFGSSDIYISNSCNNNDNSYVNNYGNGGYDSDYSHECSLFVNTGSYNDKNYFTVLDYEVYYIVNYKDYVTDVCKYDNIIWYYIQNNDITENHLKDVDEEQDLLHDLDVIHNEDRSIRYKILRYLRDPSSFLPDTHIVSTQYDSILKEWIGDNTMKLAYRASDHGYSGSSFHQYCDDLNSPTLIVIKSDKGWIFGGYTSQSWDGDGISFFSFVINRGEKK